MSFFRSLFVAVDSSFFKQVGDNVGDRLFDFRIGRSQVEEYTDYRDQEARGKSSDNEEAALLNFLQDSFLIDGLGFGLIRHCFLEV